MGGESRDIVVSYGAARYPATRIAADPRSGLAILKVEARQDAVSAARQGLGPERRLAGDDHRLSARSPAHASVGCVGGFGISSGDRYFAVSHIRANVAAQRGEGGAPLLNMDGEVVGILESSLDGGAGCFVLPIEAAEKVHSDVVRFGEARPGWLGIRFEKADSPDNQIEVQGFVPRSPAAGSGIQPGDVILQVGERKIASFDDVLDAAFYLTSGDEVPITVSRGGQAVELKMTPAPNPLAPQEEVVQAPGFSVRLSLGR